ncbi:MAG: hypothetical protein HY241_09655 [Actinobacteria bacterium]|nr:hypothetical protein [Actinomycetota bacterium]
MPDANDSAVLDTSCRHAALMRLLRWLGPEYDPRLALGDTADTRARTSGDRVGFVDLLPALAGSLEIHGFALRRHDLHDVSPVLTALVAGRTVAVDADTFHLAYYYLDYQRVHALHSITLEDFDAATSTVRVVDAVDAVFFDDRVRLADLEPALLSGQGQTWWELNAIEGGEPYGPDQLRRQLPLRVVELVGCGEPGTVSGVELATFIVDHLGEYSGTARRDSEGAGTDGARARSASNVMWNYNHTLRWFACFLRAVADDTRLPTAAAATALDGSAQDWLVARNLIMRAAVSDRSRVHRYVEKISQRLASAVEHLDHCAAALDDLQEAV